MKRKFVSDTENKALDFKHRFCFFILLFFCGACATTYEDTALKSWDLMRGGRVDEALSLYEKNVTSDQDRLLRLMDEGILLRVGERYKESSEKFFEAAKLIEQSGYLSLGEQSLTLLTNEKQTTYQGEDFEKVLVHMYLALNFIALNELDSALVEARRVNEILYLMISEAKRPYELNAFAKYLGGLLFEADHDLNNARVSYLQTMEMDASSRENFDPLRLDLFRVTKKLGMSQELNELKEKFGLKSWEKADESLKEQNGAVVLLFEVGKSPRKFSSRERHVKSGKGGTAIEVLLPVAYYKNRSYQVHRVLMEISGQKAEAVALNSIRQTAVQHLEDRMGRAIAKAFLTAGVKAGIAAGVGTATNSKELGFLTAFALFLASEADTRSWLLLPAELQVAKVFLKPGTYSVALKYQNAAGRTLREEKIPSVVVKANQPTFIQRRAFD